MLVCVRAYIGLWTFPCLPVSAQADYSDTMHCIDQEGERVKCSPNMKVRYLVFQVALAGECDGEAMLGMHLWQRVWDKVTGLLLIKHN